MSNAINELKKMLLEAAAAQKKSQEPNLKEEIIIAPTAIEEEDVVKKTMHYLNSPRKSEPIVRNVAENIETQRWNDPLRREPSEKFVTFKEMNDHYGLFLQRIQQQMSSIGGGGEVNFSRLDDINSATVGTNKYLTYDQATKKFIFDTIETGDGLYLNGSNEVSLSVASSSDLGGIKIGTAFTIDGSDRLQLNAATNDIIGGVRLGPGVTTNNQGQIIISSEGLDFSFGDFQATVPANGAATLSSVNLGQNIDIVSSANGVINVIGNFHVHTPDTYDPIDPDANGAVFRVDESGKVRILVPNANSSEGAVEIIGGSGGVFQSPVNTGVMLHVTGIAGSPGVPSRIYNDSQNAFSAFVSRRYNNTAASPSAVLADEEIMRLSGTAHNGTIIPGTANQRIVYKALGNQTLTNQGGYIELWATPINTTTLAKIATVDSTGITLESGKVLTGNVSGSAGSVAAANVTGTTLASNVVTSSLTSVGTLGSLTVTNLVTARNYHGQSRDAGTLGAAGTLTIDFATDHNVLVELTTTAVIAFSNITAGKTVTVLVKNDTGSNRAVTTGVNAGNHTGNNTAPNVNDGRTGVFIYRTFGTATGDVYVEISV